jgi:PIN domain nuclease of toxin-antitoxin system
LSATGLVLDASAVIAAVNGEKGGDLVFPQLMGATISAVNWAEVVERLTSAGVSGDGLRADLEGMGVRIAPVNADQAELAAHLRKPTRKAGLSLADRLCIALGAERGVPVLTADRAWADLDLGVEIRLIR